MLEHYYVKSGVIPNGGGWRYEQRMKDGSLHRIPLKGCAGTDKRLVGMVRLFRANVGLEEGNVESDVAEYIRKVSPPNDRFPGKDHQEAGVKPKYKPPIERLREWLRAVIHKRPHLIIEDEADKRAMTCISCPMNTAWKTGCLPCCEDVTMRGQHLRQRVSYKWDRKLNACRLHGIHLPSAIFLDRECLPECHKDAPIACFLQK